MSDGSVSIGTGALTAAFVHLIANLEARGLLTGDEFAFSLREASERLSSGSLSTELRELADCIRKPGPRLAQSD